MNLFAFSLTEHHSWNDSAVSKFEHFCLFPAFSPLCDFRSYYWDMHPGYLGDIIAMTSEWRLYVYSVEPDPVSASSETIFTLLFFWV